MEPTEAEGRPLVADGSGHAVTGPADPFASFLQTVQAMVQEDSAEPAPAQHRAPEPLSRRDRRAARKAAKAARRHEDKLARAERRSARANRSRPRVQTPEIITTAQDEEPSFLDHAPAGAVPQRVPAQAAEPVLDTVSDSDASEVAEQGRASAGRRADRRQRREEAAQDTARAASVPTVDSPEPGEGAAELDPADDLNSDIPVDAGLAGIRFTAADPVPVRRSRGSRRLDRRRDAARAVAAAVPTAELAQPAVEPAVEPSAEPGLGPVPGAGPGVGPGTGGEPPAAKGPRVPRRERRRERREAKALRKPDEYAGSVPPDDPRPDAEPDVPAVTGRRDRRERREAKAEDKARRAREKADAKARAKALKAQAEVDRILASVEKARAKAEARAARQSSTADRAGDRDAPATTRPDPGPALDAPAALTRRGRREERALARKVATAARLGESRNRPDEPEDLAGYVARVQSPRLRWRSRRSRPRTPLWFRRTVKVSAVVILVAACATLPWAAPQVPDMIAGVLPGHGTTPVRVDDPPVAPPKDAIVGPVGVGQMSGPYDGVRLQAAGWPRQVEVQRLHVDSQVVPISGQSGSLLPPSDPQLLGWWKEGRPVGAQFGTAVITGHTVHTGGGALDHLDQLVVGDSVRVRTDAGWIRYVVQRTQIYSTERLAREAKDIFRLGGSGRLVLITCDDWDGKEYRSNAIVIATPVLDQPSAS